MSKSVHKEVVFALKKHLEQYMPNLADVLAEFPEPNEQLKYPCISISLGNPEHTPLDPHELSKDVAVNNRAKVRYVTGMYDYTIQLDLWCSDKFQRFAMLEEFYQAFNQNIVPMGLSLQLVDYWGVWCRYDMTGHNLDDTEISSQRSEWRARIDLLANTRAVIEKEQYIVQTIENNLETPDTEIE